MTPTDIHLFFHSLASLLSSIISLVYFLRWRNGKAWIAITTFLVLGYFAHAHLFAFLHIYDRATYGAIYIRPFLHVAYMLLGAHFIYDWVRKSKELKLDKEEELKFGNAR